MNTVTAAQDHGGNMDRIGCWLALILFLLLSAAYWEEMTLFRAAVSSLIGVGLLAGALASRGNFCSLPMRQRLMEGFLPGLVAVAVSVLHWKIFHAAPFDNALVMFLLLAASVAGRTFHSRGIWQGTAGTYLLQAAAAALVVLLHT
jgi:hypothetical protein